MILEHSLVTASGGTPSKLVVFLHGILGSGANLRTHARQFVEQAPTYQAVLMDLRCHGHSLGDDGRVDSIHSAALDVIETARTLALPLEAVVGHSFGGKVALEVARLVEPFHVMTLDSTPGIRFDARGSETTVQVIDWLSTPRGPWALRDEFIRDVLASGIAGVTAGLAQWLAMNLERREGLLHVRLSMPRIHALIESYLTVDLWSVIEAARSNFHLVIGNRSRVYDEIDRQRAFELERHGHNRITVDLLDAGHWVHVDDPSGLSRVLAARLGS